MGKQIRCLMLILAVTRICAAQAPALPCWVFLDADHEQILPLEAELRPLPKALERRGLRGSGDWPEWVDRPLPAAWVKQVEELSSGLRVQSRWLRAVSVLANREQQESIRALPGVRDLRPVHRGRRVSQNPDPYEGGERLEYGDSQTQLEQIGVPAAHEQGLSGADVLVLMIDSGYYKEHESLADDRIVAEWDFVFDDGDTQNEAEDVSNQHNHGTATSTALGGYSPGELYGPAYACDFLLAKTEDLRSETPIEEDYLVAALEWGEPLGADLASISLGYTGLVHAGGSGRPDGCLHPGSEPGHRAGNGRRYLCRQFASQRLGNHRHTR